MTHTELTERLVQNLTTAIKVKGISRDPNQLIIDMGTAAMSRGKIDGNFSIEESWASTTCYISLPGQLSRLVQLLNIGEKIIDLDSSQSATLEDYFEQIRGQRDNIEGQIQNIIENKDLVFTDGHEVTPISDLLIEELDNLDDESQRLAKCFEKIVGGTN